MARIPFVGPSYNLESRSASVQRTVNMVPVPIEPGNERAGWGFEDVPGLVEVELTPPPPHGCYVTEAFEDGLGAYSVVSGNGALFTTEPDTYGDALKVASQNTGTQAIIARTFDEVTATRIVARFRIDADASDDAAILGLRAGGVAQFSLLPRRETALDASRRCHMLLLGETVMTPAALDIGDWHEAVVELVAGAGNSTYTITNLATEAEVSGAFVGDVESIPVDELRFTDDSDGPTCETSYDDICIGF